MTTLALHNYWRSSASYRVRIALGLKGLRFDYLPVDVLAGEQRSAAYAARNPMQQVPTLEVIEDDGRKATLVQSIAIIEYLDERWPEPPLLPGGGVTRARIRALAEIVNAGIQPFQNLPTMARVKAMGGDDKAWSRDYIERGLAAYARLVDPAPARFSIGDRPTLADCCLVPQLYAARRFGASLAGLDRLIAIDAACAEVEAIAAAHPDRQPDARRQETP